MLLILCLVSLIVGQPGLALLFAILWVIF